MRRLALSATATLSLVAALASCAIDNGTAPIGRQPPYLAVVVVVDAPDEVQNRGPYSLRVREFSGTVRFDTSFRATPRDTVIFSVQPATYTVEISDVPASCGVRDGTLQFALVPPRTNTTLARFSIVCRNALTLITLSDGLVPDSSYIYAVTRGDTAISAGQIAANDTLLIDGLKPGDYTVTLRHVAAHCVVLSDGGDNATFRLTDKGGHRLVFRITCSDEKRRPRLVEFRGSYDRGSVGYFIRVFDPNRDIDHYSWDITDCRRKSILPGGPRRRGALLGFENVSFRDTATIIGAHDVGLPDSTLRKACQAVSVHDEYINVTEVVEIPLLPRRVDRSPVATTFNVVYIGTVGMRIVLNVQDPDNDFLGVFVIYTLRDGIVALPPDGEPDRVLFQPPGQLGSEIRDIPFNVGFGTWTDYYGAIVWLLDKAGNMTRLEDRDPFR